MPHGDPAVADGFEVTPAALTGAAGVFDVEAITIDELGTSLAQRLESFGPCWGDDAVATRFGTAYQDAGLAVLDNLHALAVGAARIGGALRAVADAYECGERAMTATSAEAAGAEAAGTTGLAHTEDRPDGDEFSRAIRSSRVVDRFSETPEHDLP